MRIPHLVFLIINTGFSLTTDLATQAISFISFSESSVTSDPNSVTPSQHELSNITQRNEREHVPSPKNILTRHLSDVVLGHKHRLVQELLPFEPSDNIYSSGGRRVSVFAGHDPEVGYSSFM